MRGSPYAKNTKVPVKQSLAEIEGLLARFGGDRFDHMVDTPKRRDIILFDLEDKPGSGKWLAISFGIPWARVPKDAPRRWREAVAGIKGKLICVNAGIETPVQAFFAHIVTGKDETLFEKVLP